VRVGRAQRGRADARARAHGPGPALAVAAQSRPFRARLCAVGIFLFVVVGGTVVSLIAFKMSMMKWNK
jgi:hypothetical protein